MRRLHRVVLCPPHMHIYIHVLCMHTITINSKYNIFPSPVDVLTTGILSKERVLRV